MHVLVERALTRTLNQLSHSAMSNRKPEKNPTYHRCIDEVKREKSFDSKRSKIVSNVNNIEKNMLEESILWSRPEFATIRHVVDTVYNSLKKSCKQKRVYDCSRKQQRNITLYRFRYRNIVWSFI